MLLIDRKAGEGVRIGGLRLRVLAVGTDRVVLALDGPEAVDEAPRERGEARHERPEPPRVAGS
jgi:sRNA-binding carbon storage regulator CsrA